MNQLTERNERPAGVGEDALECDDEPLDDVRVLLVEDDPICREALSLALASRGALVTAVGSVPDALESIGENAPAVLLSDIEMPGQDGFDLIRQVRALDADRSRRTPAIAVTGLARLGTPERVRAAGFDDHFAKPLDFDHLVARIRGLIAA